MTRLIRMKSGSSYAGDTALQIVEQMRQADFDPPPTVREYVARAIARASMYFGITMTTDHLNGDEATVAEEFLKEAIAKGFAEEESAS